MRFHGTRPEPMPLTPVDPREHIAHFYASDEELIGQISAYVIDALNSDETAMVVAARSHMIALEAALVGAGINLDRVRSESRLVTLDAEEALQHFIVDDRPGFDEFIADVGVLIPRL